MAIYPSDYLGVSVSTRRAFGAAMPVPPNVLLSKRQRESLCHAIEAADPKVLVLSGFAAGYADFAKDMHARRPEIPIMALWHGTPMQLGDPEERRQYDAVLSLARSGVVSRVGTFKTGQAAALVAQGIDAMDLFNPPPTGSPAKSVGRSRGAGSTRLRLGLFSAGPSWRKNPYAMLAAAGRVGNAEIHGVLDTAAQSYARGLGVALGKVRERAWSSEEIVAYANNLDLNLYVGLSECSPLFPLESLHAGVPCLIGANSHLFQGSPLLFDPENSIETETAAADAARILEGLVVSRADDPVAIFEAIERVERCSEEILAAYQVWHEPYRRAASASFRRLLGVSPRVGPV